MYSSARRDSDSLLSFSASSFFSCRRRSPPSTLSSSPYTLEYSSKCSITNDCTSSGRPFSCQKLATIWPTDSKKAVLLGFVSGVCAVQCWQLNWSLSDGVPLNLKFIDSSTRLALTRQSLSSVETAFAYFSLVAGSLGGLGFITLSTRLLVNLGWYTESFSPKILRFCLICDALSIWISSKLCERTKFLGELTGCCTLGVSFLFLMASLTSWQILLACAQMTLGLKIDLLFSSFVYSNTTSGSWGALRPTLAETEAPRRTLSWICISGRGRRGREDREWFLELAQTLPSIHDMSFCSNHFLTCWSIRWQCPLCCLFTRTVPASVVSRTCPPSVTAQSVMASLICSLKSTVAAKLERTSRLCVVRTAISQELLFTRRMYSPCYSSCERGSEAVFFCLARLNSETDVFSPIMRQLWVAAQQSMLYWFSKVSPSRLMHFIRPFPQASSLFPQTVNVSTGISIAISRTFINLSSLTRQIRIMPPSSPMQTKSSLVSKDSSAFLKVDPLGKGSSSKASLRISSKFYSEQTRHSCLEIPTTEVLCSIFILVRGCSQSVQMIRVRLRQYALRRRPIISATSIDSLLPAYSFLQRCQMRTVLSAETVPKKATSLPTSSSRFTPTILSRWDMTDLTARTSSYIFQRNMARFAQRVTTNSPTALTPKHCGNSSFSRHSRGSSLQMFSLLVGGGFGNLLLRVKVAKSTAFTNALSPAQMATPLTISKLVVFSINKSTHFSTRSYCPCMMHSSPSELSSTTLSWTGSGSRPTLQTPASMNSLPANFLPKLSTRPSSIQQSSSFLLTASPLRKAHTLKQLRPRVTRSPLESKKARFSTLVRRLRATVSAPSQRNRLPSWLDTDSRYLPSGEKQTRSIDCLCPFSSVAACVSP